MRAYGLQTHIWNNRFKSVLLLAGFPVLLLLMMYGVMLLWAGLSDAGDGGYANPFVAAAQMMTTGWPYAFAAAGVWFTIAFFAHQAMINAATGARPAERAQEPALYNLLENLCISRGLPMPKLMIIETPALNAYASGLSNANYAVTVTRGLMERLEPAELEAVLAHELTHIRNNDVRLLVIAVIFVGIFSFIGEGLGRSLRYVNFGGGSGRSRSRDSDSGGGAAIVAIIAAFVIIAIAYGLAVVVRFSLSRKREFLADAGAVELTKNPDAMISALRKIAGSEVRVDAPPDVREMFFDNPRMLGSDLFATHPPIEKRIAALVQFAAGRDAAVAGQPTSPRAGPWSKA